jgi:type 1 glutamine amidotransferase
MFQKLAFLTLGIAALSANTVVAGEKKIRVVIVDGQNNHDWRSTTPVMKKALEECGRFTVDVATSPPIPALAKPTKPKNENDEKTVEKYKAALAKYEAALPKFNEQLKAAQEAFKNWQIDFDKYDVIVSNYNGQSWPKQINADLEDRLKAGKIGLVIVHAANNSFGGWKEYNQMIGMGWRDKNYGKRLKLDDEGKTIIVPAGKDGSTSHAYTGPFKMIVRDHNHPVTKGMPTEWMHARDELYDNLRGPIENVHVLATAIAPAGKGTGVHEPMIFTIDYGKGKVFHTPMGHDVTGMRCMGFITTLQRGTEWAATGAVTIPIPTNFPTASKESSLPK